jgi:hypothetical protein
MIAPGPEALVAYLEAREGWAFGYGPDAETHDCARWADGLVAAVHGQHPLRRFSSEWTTRRGARRVLARHGGMAASVSEVMREISPTLAQRGDIGMTEAGELVGFVGDQIVGLAAPRGYRWAPRANAVRAWTVRPEDVEA